MAQVPAEPKIYHIVHVDRLPSIIASGCLWSDAEVGGRSAPGTTIGMSGIKTRRLSLSLASHSDLYVGDCVPFYFCPRSVMLYLIHQANNPDLAYSAGQGPIIHLEADLRETVAWADSHRRRWAFTLSNAGSRYFEDRSDLANLHEINWRAVQARDWRTHKEGKQAEFLIEREFPLQLVGRIGVHSQNVLSQVRKALSAAPVKPPVEIIPDWYY